MRRLRLQAPHRHTSCLHRELKLGLLVTTRAAPSSPGFGGCSAPDPSPDQHLHQEGSTSAANLSRGAARAAKGQLDAAKQGKREGGCTGGASDPPVAISGKI